MLDLQRLHSIIIEGGREGGEGRGGEGRGGEGRGGWVGGGCCIGR